MSDGASDAWYEERQKEWDLIPKPVWPVTGGVKYDHDKPRHDLIPPEAVDGLAKVLTFGAKKYNDRNWERGMEWGRVYAALQRHILAWWKREDTDPETGLSHLHHAAACIAFLQTYEARNIGQDTRPATQQKETHGNHSN